MRQGLQGELPLSLQLGRNLSPHHFSERGCVADQSQQCLNDEALQSSSTLAIT